jgi:pimeloyl-ACP methyl ester carboxylesterase
VIRYDMRGFGQSDVATGPVSRRDDLFQLLNHLGVDHAALVGCSASGEAILDLALEHPQMVTALVIVSAVPSGFELQGAPPRYVMEMVGAMQQSEVERASELQIRISVDGEFREPEQVDPAVRAQASAMNRIAVKNGTFFIADAAPLNPLTPPAFGRLHEIDVPTLIIAGSLDSPEIVRAADIMAAEIKGAKKLIIPDTAHVPNMEQPEVFNQAVLSFLRG